MSSESMLAPELPPAAREQHVKSVCREDFGITGTRGDRT